MRFSPDGTLLAAGFDDHTAKLYRIVENGLVRELVGHSKPVTSVDFSPDGTVLATAAADGDARLWRVADGTLVRTIPGGGGRTTAFITSEGRVLGRLRFSADGKSLVGVSDGAVRFWSVADGRLLLTYPDLEASCVAVSPDGRHFAYGTGGQFGSANAAVVLARWPLLVTGAGMRTNAIELNWQGGSGVYQVEGRTNAKAGAWEVLAGPLTNTNATLPATNRAGFFRVRSLPEP